MKYVEHPDAERYYAATLAPRAEGITERYHHGRTPAAWVGSMVALVGFVVAAIGFFMNINWIVVALGLVVVLGGAIAGGLMSRAGRGQVWE
ncbi:HGxxPAAW family protein [Nigerium massiliense]|uniref:HGxxPAAW family protein n=1 Tax=Nigerium massiliense TaxID=1522317 RepID=UPI00069344C6|nr:HGxxPAAW family protein [Nigerium massiliense]